MQRARESARRLNLIFPTRIADVIGAVLHTARRSGAGTFACVINGVVVGAAACELLAARNALRILSEMHNQRRARRECDGDDNSPHEFVVCDHHVARC